MSCRPEKILNSDLSKKPNIVWVVIDSLRGDCFKIPEAVPNLTEFRKTSDHYQNHLVNSSWTRPSTLVFFTGQYASRLPVNFWDYPVTKEEALDFKHQVKFILPKALRNLGYKTIMIGNNPFLEERYGLGVDVGFEELYEFSLFSNDTPRITSKVREFLEKPNESPFFLFLNYNDPHKPYTPPGKFLANLTKLSFEDPRERDYFGEVAYVDEELGEVLGLLRSKNLFENSIILVTSDHGEVMNPLHSISPFTGTDTYFGHGQDLLWENIHVPLFWKSPKQRLGTSITNFSRSIDLSPSLWKAIGESQLQELDGRPLQDIAWEKEQRPYYGETRFTQSVGIKNKWLLQRSFRFHRESKFWDSRNVGRENLYYFDRDRDPEQLEKNIYNSRKDIREKEFDPTIVALLNYLENTEPKLPRYNVYASKQSSDDLEVSVRVPLGSLRDEQGNLLGQFYKKVMKPGESFVFEVYPNASLPTFDFKKKGILLPKEEWRIGTFGVKGNCLPNCQSLLDGRSPIDLDSGSVRVWREGFVSHGNSSPGILENKALEILRKQGYVD